MKTHYAVFEWNTDPDGKWVEEDDPQNLCYYGPFDTEEAAGKWMQDAFSDDTDVRDAWTEYDEVDPEWLNDPAKHGYVTEEADARAID